MTVTYSRSVADAGLGTFSRLLLRWKGSIYKLLYRELILFTALYCSFSWLYRYRGPGADCVSVTLPLIKGHCACCLLLFIVVVLLTWGLSLSSKVCVERAAEKTV